MTAVDSKKNWGDQDYEEDKNEDVPKNFVSADKGIKTVTEYRTLGMALK